MNQSLQDIAKALVAPKKGILAADESTSTMTKRLQSVGVESTEENRRIYRQMLFTSKGWNQYISGVILFDETIRQRADDGHTFVTVMEQAGVIPGIKVDMGAKPLAGSEGETITEGLDGLRERLKEYYNFGARFAKWRGVISIDEKNNLPTPYALHVNAHALARYAALCQEAGLVPIVEPEVLMDGSHSIDVCFDSTERMLRTVFDELDTQGVVLDGILLKPNMVIAGKDASAQATSEQIAEMTVRCFKEVVPANVPGIVFLSGGQSEQEACQNLNTMNAIYKDAPWQLSFSYGRALQQSVLSAWGGKSENITSAQETFLKRARLTSEARNGTYDASME